MSAQKYQKIDIEGGSAEGAPMAKRPLTLVRRVGGGGMLLVLGLFLAAMALDRIGRYKVISSSMYPTLQIGDYVFSTQGPDYQPRRGDIVIFWDPEVKTLARNLCMHVAATSPIGISREELPAEEVERERVLLRKQAEAEGKPAAVVEKMVEGRLNKFFKEVVLLEQPLVMDPDQMVKAVVKAAGNF